jgi:hypothetical protein
MVKDTSGICPIVVSKVFLWLIICSIVLQLQGSLKNTYPPISLEYQPPKGYENLFNIQALLNLHPD